MFQKAKQSQTTLVQLFGCVLSSLLFQTQVRLLKHSICPSCVFKLTQVCRLPLVLPEAHDWFGNGQVGISPCRIMPLLVRRAAAKREAQEAKMYDAALLKWRLKHLKQVCRNCCTRYSSYSKNHTCQFAAPTACPSCADFQFACFDITLLLPGFCGGYWGTVNVVPLLVALRSQPSQPPG